MPRPPAHFGMKAHIGVDADASLVHKVVGTAANVNDVTQAHALVHGEETDVFADAGYQGVGKRAETQEIEVNWHVAMRPGKRKALDKSTPMGAIMDKLEQAKARIRAKVEHQFRVVKRQFGHVKVRYRRLAKNMAQLHTLFALSAVQLVDGTAHAAAGDAGMSSSNCGQRAASRGEIGLEMGLVSRKSPLSEMACINSRCGGRCADHPKAKIV